MSRNDGRELNEPEKNEGNLPAIYEGDNGQIELRFDGDRETIWATQAQMSELFGVGQSVVSKHIANIFHEGELDELSNMQKMHIAQSTKPVTTYTLDVILSVGYRVNSVTATKFRRWATRTLSEFIREGAVVDDRRLAENPELARRLAAKIRHIRTSEINLYTKVRDVFKESASDYDVGAPTAHSFFAMAQDKFHYAITQKTAAELILERAHPLKHNMGLVSVQGETPTIAEAKIGKNYLTPDELHGLENISEQFLLYAESKAFRGQKMTMEELAHKLNALLEVNDYPVLYEYKAFLRGKADAYAKKVHDEYLGQLKGLNKGSNIQLPGTAKS
jgi:hypothetical protein